MLEIRGTLACGVPTIMKSSSYLIAIFLVQLPLSAHADSSDIEVCKRIDNDTRRLACYDELFQESGAVEKFAAEQLPKPPVTFIEARLVGHFNGWTGKTVFTLDNGQVWRQTKNYIRDYTPRSPIPAPRVTISKGMLGSYNMQVEGVKRIVQVKRVK
jgi:hypothetical protein